VNAPPAAEKGGKRTQTLPDIFRAQGKTLQETQRKELEEFREELRQFVQTDPKEFSPEELIGFRQLEGISPDELSSEDLKELRQILFP